MLPLSFSPSLPGFILPTNVSSSAAGAPLEKYLLYSGDLIILQTQGWRFLNPATAAQGNWHAPDGNIASLAQSCAAGRWVVPVPSCRLWAPHSGTCDPHRRG